MFKNFKFGRNQIIAGVIGLMVLITGGSMFRISYNQDIIDSYEGASKKLPERTKIGMLDGFWQQYTGGTRKTTVSLRDVQSAKQAISSSYGFMFGVDAVLGVAAAVLILQPVVANRLNRKK